MNKYGSILVHLDNSHRSEFRLRMALRIKQKLHGQQADSCAINALYAPTPHYLTIPSVYGDVSANTIEIIFDTHEKNKAAEKVRFEHWKKQTNENAHWIENDAELVLQGVINQALFSDLLVLGQFDPNPKMNADIPPDFVQSIIIGSATPAVVVPYTGAFQTLGTNVLIAWKPTREASNALKASIPFLQTADSIHFVADSDSKEIKPLQDRLEAYLRSNDINLVPTYHAFDNSDTTAERLLSLAADIQADLLVMGCYGHSRLREFIIGGVSKTILSSMTLPVLMAH
jgi:nucleotide-binding universal stress UspA family protein